MPVYKTTILNNEINFNYNLDEKEKLINAIDLINQQLKEYNHLNGRISDSKILSMLAIKLQAEISEIKKDKKFQNEIDISKSTKEDIIDKETIFNLKEQIKEFKNQNEILEKNIDQILKEISLIINLIKDNYE